MEVRTRTAKEKGVDEFDALYCPSQHHVAHDLVRHIIDSHAMLQLVELRGPYNFQIFFHDSFDASASVASRCTRIILWTNDSPSLEVSFPQGCESLPRRNQAVLSGLHAGLQMPCA